MPAWARILLALLRGELEAIDAAFAGWIIRRGELVSPEGWCFAPAEISTIPLLYGQVNLWRGQALALAGRAPVPALRARRISRACGTGRPSVAAAGAGAFADGASSSP